MVISSDFQIKQAARALIAGNLVAFPTETVYGLGADAMNKDAVSRLYRIKKRPVSHPIIVHLYDLTNLEYWVKEVPDYFSKLYSKFAPGPITFILRKRKSLDVGYLTGNQNKVGIRIPSNKIAQVLLHEFQLLNGKGIAAPSANKFGEVTNTSAKRIIFSFANELQSGDIILDGGISEIGIESTILDCTAEIPTILRPGFISKKEIESCLEIQINVVTNHKKAKIDSKYSGMFSKHYSPKARVFYKGNPKPGSGYIGLSSSDIPKGVIVLSLPENLTEFARILYESFHQADELGLKSIFVSIPDVGELAEAIKDRVLKAAGVVSI